MKYLIITYLIGVLLATISNRHAKKMGQEGIPFKDTLNPFKWFSVVYGFVLSLIIPRYIFVQYAQRVFNSNCQPCLKQGYCTGGLNKLPGEEGCGCATYAKMMSPFEKDYSENWNKIIFSKAKFLEKIEKYPIVLGVTKITKDEFI